jgi:ADP-ribosyl-[dinitrogen reductase] hydrolase
LANGNGSLMRVLPLALWHKGTDEDLVHDAHQQSIVTHGHVRSQVCCALYCLWARCTLTESKDAWTEAASRLIKIYDDNPAARYELEETIRPHDPAAGKAISLGDDTDTTACVAGGIAGIRNDINPIPERWRAQLRGKDLYEPQLQSLIDRYQE